MDTSGKVLLSNQAAEEMLGCGKEELPEKGIVDFIYQQDMEHIPYPLIEAIHMVIFRAEFWMRTKRF